MWLDVMMISGINRLGFDRVGVNITGPGHAAAGVLVGLILVTVSKFECVGGDCTGAEKDSVGLGLGDTAREDLDMG
jgi:hypothetical protein